MHGPRRAVTLLAALASGCAAIAGLDDEPPSLAGAGFEAGARDGDAPDGGGPPGPAAPIELGNGTDGALTASGALVVNTYFRLLADAPQGARVVAVGDPRGAARASGARELRAGDLLLVWQASAVESIPLDPARASLSPWAAGRFELARAASVEGAAVTLDRPLTRMYTYQGAQLVRVPEHTTVDVPAGASLRAEPWDGQRGGVLALFATGAVTLTGALDATGAGLRGGIGADAPDTRTCDGEGPHPRHARKGEGHVLTAYTDPGRAGRARAEVGGGGGVCLNSGGGGGGHRGGGGGGGRSFAGTAGDTDGDRAVGGLGGAGVDYAPEERRLVLGGGGGAGHANNDKTPHGGAGGGAIYVRAFAIAGQGELLARGAPGTNADDDGAGGGGAGGAVLIELREALACRLLSVAGGAGGDVRQDIGPGGGGGGGDVHARAREIACPFDLSGGGGGKNVAPTPAAERGAGSGEGGREARGAPFGGPT